MKELSKESVTFLEVGEDGAGQRIDNFLMKRLKGVPKSHVYRILRSGEVRVNKGRASADRRLALGDQVRVPPVRVAQKDDDRPVPGREFSLVFEDDALIVIDKPAGVAVHGGSGVSFGVIEQIRQTRPTARFLELAHRLDRETSGLLLIGKKRSALTRLHDLFRDGGIDKRYLALVKGHWRDSLRNVKLPLLKYLTAEGERRVRVSPDGKEAHSIMRLKGSWKTLWGDFSLLEVELRTGRTHQIRVHLAHLGFPIAGDEKYGDFALNRDLQKVGLKRMFLHAASMRLPHPISGEVLALTAPLPRELAGFVAKIEKADDATL
ncbi:MAG TPA: RluA family pseudouridine synthase [Gammaproteobacteria bacterium]|nr:RluA family pseudouridine synthase [Gammaproteobacteria bacterium]